jgi:hypothetical protein
MSARRRAAEDVSIYEVRTGIHFEVPGKPEPENDCPEEALAVLSRMPPQAE